MRPVASILLPVLAILAMPGLAFAQERKAEHPMTDDVVAIDHDTGVVLVNTEPVPMTVHFPKEHVQELKAGDTITVHLSFEKGQKQ